MAAPPAHARPLLALCVLALAWLCLACPATAPQWPEDDGFDDHTVASVNDRVSFDALAATGATGTAALKFVIVEFADPKDRVIRYLDGRFYAFHDEWYWYRLVNGQAVPGSRERPLSGLSFATVADIVDWIRSRNQPPPLGMRMIDDRLYSDHFYDISVHRERRVLGIGTIVHMPARTGAHPRDELWGFELEYSDAVEAEALEVFFAQLRASLPAEIASALRFVARSPHQTELVARLRHRGHPLGERLTSYAELAVPGEIEVYNPGLIAGRLRKLPDDPARAAALLTAGDSDAIWIMPSVPDELPAAAGLLTAVPQTPLAHVNLLARNRGIPNVYVGGVMTDPHLDQLSRIHAPVVLLARGEDGDRDEGGAELRIEPITEQDYARWRALSRRRPPTMRAVDPSSLPYTIDLDAEPVERVPELRTFVGGKASGFPILRAAGATMPDRPLAITIRAYAEHIAKLRPVLEDLLVDPAFVYDARARYLLLEGREDFDARFSGPVDRAWVEQFEAAHPARRARQDPFADILARGGIKRAIRDQPLNPEAARAIDAALQAHFGRYAASQGLRFRSSSTVEDVEGFSGAGLYDSNTGFLDPEAQADEGDRKKSVAWAVRKTWASYWSWEAFEERQLSGINHLAGNMAVLVHARFDDDFEDNNGVLTMTLDVSEDRRGDLQAPARPRAVTEIDVQLGALSVTNPPPERAGEVLPEVDLVYVDAPGAGPRIERRARSTEIEAGPEAGHILDDAAVEALHASVLAIAERWLEVENAALPEARARGRVTLDLEFRGVKPGWPALADGTELPARLVIKQVRSLDPGVPVGAEALLDQPIPRDLLLFADRVERRRCQGRRARVDLLEVWTDPMARPDLGHGVIPFLARIRVEARGLEGGPRQFDLDHLEFDAVAHPGLERGGPWALSLELEPTVAPTVGIGVDRIELGGGLLRLLLNGELITEEPAPCTTQIAHASPDGLLLGLLGPRG